jgi:endoglucanase
MSLVKAFLTTSLLVGFLSSPAIAQDIPSHSDFDMKKCVNMGNSLESPRGESWGKPINIADFKVIRNKGFDTVRIPVRWDDYTGSAPAHTIEADFMSKVVKIVDAALAEDLNVILNIHHFDEIMENPKQELPQLVALWKQIATRFRNHPKSLWFETLNEPHKNLNGKLMQAAQVAATLAIRETNPDRIIILGGENWSGIDSLPSNIVPPDEHIVYTYHYYDPFDFTHQKAPWLGESMPKKKRGWGSRQDKVELQTSIEKAVTFRDFVDRPVFVGEFGVYEGVANKERVKFIEAARIAMEGANIPWCLWSYSNTFALYNNDTKKFDKDVLKALGTTEGKGQFQTGFIKESDVKPDVENWGRFLPYYQGDTQHAKDVLTGVAVIKPGQQIHPPHQHAEEEFLMIIEGEGTWTVGTTDKPAKAGDILYSAPWDRHGLLNTGKVPLKFVVFKYNSK